MKTIILVRHSKAVNHTAEITDYQRKLKKKGREEAKSQAEKLKETGLKPDLFISSPAYRAIETANEFADVFQYERNEIQLEEIIYFDFSGSKFQEIISKCPDDKRFVIIFGHEPTLSELSSLLVPGFSYAFPKTAILAIEFNIDSWKEIDAGKGVIKFFMIPAHKKLNDYKY